MTVSEIKEYIDACIEHLQNIDYFEHIRMFIGTLEKIKSMLDELETKAKWKIDGHHRRCEKCGEYFCIDDREGNEIPHNFCGNCGARMESEQ